MNIYYDSLREPSSDCDKEFSENIDTNIARQQFLKKTININIVQIQEQTAWLENAISRAGKHKESQEKFTQEKIDLEKKSNILNEKMEKLKAEKRILRKALKRVS